MVKKYDFIIIGGGIGGLNIAYQILKRFPKINLLILEKEKDLGGRVFTFHNKNMNVEAGAGRFNIKHKHFISLLKDLGLDHLKTPITSSAVYSKSDGSGRFYNSILDSDKLIAEYDIIRNIDYDSFNSLIPNISKTFNYFLNLGLDIMMGDETLPNIGLLFRIISSGMFESKEYLIKMTLLDYAKTILSKSEIQFLKDSFGYYSEIITMNAYDSIQLMRGLDPKNTFFGLKTGFSSIISALEKKILSFKGARILKQKEVSKIIYKDEGFEIYGKSFSYFGMKCICALPKDILERFAIFKPIHHLLSKIKCAPLCRIYSRFPIDSTGNVWFKGLPKFSTNNNLRMVIPISEKTGIIMISYTDNIFADFWQKIYKQSGILAVNKELNRLMKLSTGIDIPNPLETHVFYWKCGTGYWGVGADSDVLSELFIQPFPNKSLFICGENYSNTGQQWMEGALETGSRILDKLI
jgi:hypothetical protein